jgi:hypothetical protein
MKENKLVDIYMASLWRQGHVVKSVNSLLLNPEVDTITICCNNYTDEQWEFVTAKLNDPKITLHRTNNEKGSNEKLRFVGTGTNYYICLADDDRIYPPDYLNKLIVGCEKYNAYVSLHGRTIKSGIINSYYGEPIMVYNALNTVLQDVEVDIVSNCGSLFKRNFFNDLNEWYGLCGTTSMDDIYVNYFAKKRGIKRIVLAHQKGYVVHKEQLPEDDYVFNRHRYSDSVQTDFINNFFNKL